MRFIAVLSVAAALLAGCGSPGGDAVRVEFTAESLASGDATFPPGSDSAKMIGTAAELLAQRLSDSGIKDPKVRHSGDTVAVTANGTREDIVSLASSGILMLRPVLFTTLATGGSGLDIELRQASVGTPVPEMARRAQQLNCDGIDPLAGRDDPRELLVTCSSDRTQVFALGPAIVDGKDVARASAAESTSTKQWVVSLDFSGAAKQFWPRYTAENIGQQVAFVLDSRVLSAPMIQSSITGSTEISGGKSGFTEDEAKHLAAMLTTGSLPVRLVPKP